MTSLRSSATLKQEQEQLLLLDVSLSGIAAKCKACLMLCLHAQAEGEASLPDPVNSGPGSKETQASLTLCMLCLMCLCTPCALPGPSFQGLGCWCLWPSRRTLMISRSLSLSRRMRGMLLDDYRNTVHAVRRCLIATVCSLPFQWWNVTVRKPAA